MTYYHDFKHVVVQNNGEFQWSSLFIYLSATEQFIPYPNGDQLKAFDLQLRSKYSLSHQLKLYICERGFEIKLNGNQGYYHQKDAKEVDKMTEDLTREGSRDFLPIIKAMQDHDGWFNASSKWGTYPTTRPEILQLISNYPRMTLDAHFVDLNADHDDVEFFCEFIEASLTSQFEELFGWDYKTPNKKLTTDEWQKLHNYISRQLIDLKMSGRFCTILGELTDAEKARDESDLGKAVNALNKSLA